MLVSGFQHHVLTFGSYKVRLTSQSPAPSAAAKLHDYMLTVIKARMICHDSHAAASRLSRPEKHVACDVEEPWRALRSPGEPSGALGNPQEPSICASWHALLLSLFVCSCFMIVQAVCSSLQQCTNPLAKEQLTGLKSELTPGQATKGICHASLCMLTAMWPTCHVMLVQASCSNLQRCVVLTNQRRTWPR